ncbi:MAG: hypothetical protein U5L75_01035 [Candidatus Campbellbacteria bacterium]|nr:hypothetical protein [Candidatus Campbellbacteria bacterium]
MKTARVITSQILHRERMTTLLIGLILLLSLSYVFLVVETVLNAAEQRSIEMAVVDTQKEIADLQLTFMQNENDISLDYAYEHGFHDVDERVFVTRNTNLTLR